MKFLFAALLLLFFVGCQSQEDIDMTKKLVNQLTPLNANEQAEAIKACESNEGWTGRPVLFNQICVQIRCVEKGI